MPFGLFLPKSVLFSSSLLIFESLLWHHIRTLSRIAGAQYLFQRPSFNHRDIGEHKVNEILISFVLYLFFQKIDGYNIDTREAMTTYCPGEMIYLVACSSSWNFNSPFITTHFMQCQLGEFRVASNQCSKHRESDQDSDTRLINHFNYLEGMDEGGKLSKTIVERCFHDLQELQHLRFFLIFL